MTIYKPTCKDRRFVINATGHPTSYNRDDINKPNAPSSSKYHIILSKIARQPIQSSTPSSLNKPTCKDRRFVINAAGHPTNCNLADINKPNAPPPIHNTRVLCLILDEVIICLVRKI